MSYGVMQGLRDAVAGGEGRRDGARLLTGAGDKAFCVGRGPRRHRRQRRCRRRARWPRPARRPASGEDVGTRQADDRRVRASLAGGFGLALACDVVIVADDAQVRHAGGERRALAVHDHRPHAPVDAPEDGALELQMTGRRVGSDEALRIGFAASCRSPTSAPRSTSSPALASKRGSRLRWGRDAFYRGWRWTPTPRSTISRGIVMHTQSEDAAEASPVRGEAHAGLEGAVARRDPR